MTNKGDLNKNGADQPNPAGEKQQLSSSWNELAPVLVTALPLPIVFVVMWLRKPDYTEVLFTNSTGVRMLGLAVASQLIGMVVHFFWALLGSKKAPRWLSVLMIVGVFFFFYLPGIFTVLVGPAAIAIHERLIHK